MAVQIAPDFTLEHVTGRQVSLSHYRGKPVVLVVSGRYSYEQAIAVENAVRDRYGYDNVAVINVADMKGVPRLLRAVAKNDVAKGYKNASRDAARRLQGWGQPVPADMSNAVVLLVDWDSAVSTVYSTGPVDKQAVAVVIDGNGGIRGRAAGPAAVQQVLAMLG